MYSPMRLLLMIPAHILAVIFFLIRFNTFSMGRIPSLVRHASSVKNIEEQTSQCVSDWCTIEQSLNVVDSFQSVYHADIGNEIDVIIGHEEHSIHSCDSFQC